jgi:hypothetical protein
VRIIYAFLLIGSMQAITAVTVGGPLIVRVATDTASGCLFAYDGSFGTSGYVLTWSFDAGSTSTSVVAGHQVTPLILDPTTPGGWTVTGIGATRTVSGPGVNTFSFSLVSGSSMVGPDMTFGWYDGSPTAVNAGTISFDRTTTAIGFRDFVSTQFPVIGKAYATSSDFTGANDGTSWTGGRIYSVQFTTAVGVAADSPYQVKYVSNIAAGDSVINITNTGANGGVGLGLGTDASVPGAFCANVYVYDPSEAIVSCCSCPVTPNGLVSLSAKNDLINNPLTRGNPTSIVIKLVATVPLGGSCNSSALLAGNPTVVEGMAAWGTALHAVSSAAGTYAVTETAFTPAGLSAGELARLAYGCGAIANVGSGYGVCNSCRPGGLGAVRQ